MVKELTDENMYLLMEIKALELTETGMLLSVHRLMEIDQLALKNEVRNVLKNDGYNLNVCLIMLFMFAVLLLIAIHFIEICSWRNSKWIHRKLL